jgi:hypothetical protein
MRKLIRIAVALMAVIPAVSGRLNVARVPLSFEANQGQTGRAVKFLSRGGGYALFLTPAEAVFKLRKATASDKEPAVLRMSSSATIPTSGAPESPRSESAIS